MLRNLSSLSAPDLESFFNSFDAVLCDCDGVIWRLNKLIPGVKESLAKLRQAGKQVRFVSNNCTHSVESFLRAFRNFQLDVQVDDLAFPTMAIIDYLKKINFDKDIFLFGVANMRKQFEDAGFKVKNDPIEVVKEDLAEVPKVLKDDKEIGAVIVEIDVNFNYVKLLKAAVYLLRPEVLFIMGGTDLRVPTGLCVPLIGAGHVENILRNISGRSDVLYCGKPGEKFNDFVVERFGIQNPSRTLFIGDSLEQDMTFADKFGYRKLLVLTGITTLEQAANCTDSAMKPDYYVGSLGDLHKLMED